jgi:pimeloyl-ACP methyl ester carboxylesterase
MVRRFPLASLLALLTGLALGAPAFAQDEKFEQQDVNFSTFDGVEIQGVLYKTKKAGPQPCIMLLHSPSVAGNKGSSVGAWHELGKTLSEEGFNVLRFDFRGHQKSDLIKNKADFWSIDVNQKYLRDGYRKQPQPDSIKSSDYIKPGASSNPYLPMLVNDIMAARVFLDAKNDAGDLNTGSIYLIGAGDATFLGFLYLLAEWQRPQVGQPGVNLATLPLSAVDLANLRGRPQWAGKDIAGCIWLSPPRPVTPNSSYYEKIVKSTPQIRDSNKMLFIYGEDDTAGKGGATFFYDRALIADPPKSVRLDPIRLTKMLPIKKTKLSGVDLLGKGLGVEAEILKYIKLIEEDRKVVARITRNYTSTPYVNPVAYGSITR